MPINFNLPRNAITAFDPTLWNRVFGNQTGNTGGLNPSVTSRGSASPFNNPIPDFNQADPQKLAQLRQAASGYTYSVPGGGYIPDKDASNANSAYIKFGGSDPSANRNVQNYYDYISTLPTRATGTAALNEFNTKFGTGQPSSGPSLKQLYGQSWQPLPVSPPKFTSTPVYYSSQGFGI